MAWRLLRPPMQRLAVVVPENWVNQQAFSMVCLRAATSLTPENSRFTTNSPMDGSLQPGPASPSDSFQRSGTPAPPVWPYHKEANNTVYLNGVVISDPVDVPLRSQTQKLAWVQFCPLGFDRATRTRVPKLRVKFWGYHARQASQHVRKGAKIALRGELEEFMGRAEVSVLDFGLLQGVPQESEEPQRNPVPSAERERVFDSPFLLTSSKNTCLLMYRSGRSFDEIAEEKGIKWTTAAGYIAICAFFGEAIDWPRFCKDLKLGTPGGSFLSVDEIYAAIEKVRRESEGVEFEHLELTRILEILKADPIANNKVTAQFKATQGNGLAFAQIKAVMAMVKNGMTASDWIEFFTEASNNAEPVF